MANDRLTHERRCTAKSKQSGERCKNYAMPGFTVCRFHGAGSKHKPGGRPVVHGRYSKYLPEKLAERYSEALADPDLLELRGEIALIDTRLMELIERVDKGGTLKDWQRAVKAHGELAEAVAAKDMGRVLDLTAKLGRTLCAGLSDYEAWQEISELVEQRRKLAESEHKRLVAMGQMITAERALILLAAVQDTIRRHVTDQATLTAIAADIRRLTMVEAGD